MGKTILYRLFGLGKIPPGKLPALEAEGIVLLDEGIGGALIFRKFRAPGRCYSRKYSWFSGSIVITGRRFAAFTSYPFFNPIIDIPLADERLEKLLCSVKNAATLCILFDPSSFHEGWSGSIECRFSTPRARLYLEQLQHKPQWA